MPVKKRIAKIKKYEIGRTKPRIPQVSLQIPTGQIGTTPCNIIIRSLKGIEVIKAECTVEVAQLVKGSPLNYKALVVNEAMTDTRGKKLSVRGRVKKAKGVTTIMIPTARIVASSQPTRLTVVIPKPIFNVRRGKGTIDDGGNTPLK